MPRLPLALLSLVCFAAPAAAQETIRAMTPDAVRGFVTAMTDKTKPGGALNDRKVVLYLNRHLFDAGLYASNVTFNIPGHHPQTRAIRLDKAAFIDNVMSGRKTMRNHQSGVTVHDIEIADNKQEAAFRTITVESGEMPVEGQYVPFTGKTDCKQKIALDGTTPIILSADCETHLTFTRQ